ncbi:MAG: YkgJ family cysteine cluster protein [Lachnospiraceae bacterium]|nr:YkgJ family cysteine cluster protein [Lachnospiraceae bacterium]MDE7331589.1 YkgJ family cysteine cluster protein [Lachnospiraceae bacterium]
MEREIDLKQISDGKLYSANDMIKAGCGDCAGCSLCCHEMGNSIILDPCDIFNLEKGLHTTFEKLMESRIELNVVDGIIQPNLKMQGSRECCAFLNEEGRCAVHEFRPGFCRMFPLGRIYEDGDFRYFLQIHECPYPNKTKVKLKKWLGIPELGKYEAYVKKWHYFLKDVQEIIREKGTDRDESGEVIKKLNMYLLNQFYVKPYETVPDKGKELDFYGQFYERLGQAETIVKMYR